MFPYTKAGARGLGICGIWHGICRICPAKWWQQLLLGPYLPHAPGARMTVVKLTPSNDYIKQSRTSLNLHGLLRELVNYRHPGPRRVWTGAPSRTSCHHFRGSRGSRGSGGSRCRVPKSSKLLLFTILESSWPPPNLTPIFFLMRYMRSW